MDRRAQKLLAKEKQFSKLQDALNLQRRVLPWGESRKGIFIEGPEGHLTLADLFRAKSQLIVYHFMFARD
jgi:predicted dithiol-disulfide oxidoreductase (DUF899 family)